MPLILPEPPQSFDAFGLNLNGYLAQPGSAFVVNRYGFDTGRRRFIVNTDVADLGAFVLGTPDFKYPKMYVHKVTNEVIGGPWTIADIEYLGQIYPNKPHEISTDADIRKTGINIAFTLPGVGFTVASFQIEVAEVTVQDVYVTDVMPDLNLAGSAVNISGGGLGGLVSLSPPIAIAPPNLDSLDAAIGLPAGTLKVFSWWWELRRRALRIAGTPPTVATTTTKRYLSGNITLENGSKNFQGGANTRFLTELAVGDKIYARSPPYTVPIPGSYISPALAYLISEFTTGFTVASITDDHNGTLSAAYNNYVVSVNFTGQFYTFSTIPSVTTSTALYEVTDSWKRIVLIAGEPLANALSQ